MKKITLYTIISILTFSGCSIFNTNTTTYYKKSKKPQQSYTPHSYNKKKETFTQVGLASYYGAQYNGSLTASGERLNINKLTAAHRTLPFGTLVKVTALDSQKSVTVKINDRGPFIKGRIIDLTDSAAKKIGIIQKGIAKVKIEVID